MFIITDKLTRKIKLLKAGERIQNGRFRKKY